MFVVVAVVQASVRRCVGVMASTLVVGVSVTPDGRVSSVMCHTRSATTLHAVATASVLMALASVPPASRVIAANTVCVPALRALLHPAS